MIVDLFFVATSTIIVISRVTFLQSAAIYSSRKADDYPYSVPAGGIHNLHYNYNYIVKLQEDIIQQAIEILFVKHNQV